MHSCSSHGLLENMGKNIRCWCGAKGRLETQRSPKINHDPAPTSTPTNRPLPRDSVCLVLSSTIPSFQSVPLGFFLQDATKSATSLNHHNRLNSPDYTTYLRVYKISCIETYCRASDLMSRTRTALPASPRLASSKSNTDWPDRIGLASSFIRGITFPAIFPSTRHHTLHCGTAYTLG